MLHARSAHNPEDYRVDPAVLNPFNDPRVSEDEAIRFSMDTALCGTGDRVAEQMAALRDVGVHHVLCQMSFGYLGHDEILASMQRFGEHIVRRFRKRPRAA